MLCSSIQALAVSKEQTATRLPSFTSFRAPRSRNGSRQSAGLSSNSRKTSLSFSVAYMTKGEPSLTTSANLHWRRDSPHLRKAVQGLPGPPGPAPAGWSVRSTDSSV